MQLKGILAKLLEKRGIESLDELSKEEKETFDNYDKILSKSELTLDDVKKFLESQIGMIEGRWRDLHIEQAKKSELIPYHTTYKTLLEVIKSPQLEREALEQVLIQQLNN